MRICLFNPGIRNSSGEPSENLGDLIIQEAVDREISSLFQGCELSSISTHTYPTKDQIEVACNSDLKLVGGSNLLGSKMREYVQWKISLRQKIKLRECVLLGVGWRNYERDPDLYTRVSLKAVLSGKHLHSVRDAYTKTKLNNAGFSNIINTGCPTMWPFINFNVSEIPVGKSENALIMLTDYAREPDVDRKLVEMAILNYKRVFVWAQGKDDTEYIIDLMAQKDFPIIVVSQGFLGHASNADDFPSYPLILLNHSINTFRSFLNSNVDFDYLGTRLHGGIKCLLSKRRALILEIDNRAKEIARETGLPTTERGNFEYISHWLSGGILTKIKVDPEPINQWKSQFVRISEKLPSRVK